MLIVILKNSKHIGKRTELEILGVNFCLKKIITDFSDFSLPNNVFVALITLHTFLIKYTLH